MKIEIEIPLDENEWECVGIKYAEKGDWCLRDVQNIGTRCELTEWVHSELSFSKYPCFRKKQNWKGETR